MRKMWTKAAGLTAPLIGLGVIVGLASHGSAQAQTSLSDADCARSVAAAHTTLAQADESGEGVAQAETALAAIQRECSTAMGLTAMTSLSVADGAAASPSPPAPRAQHPRSPHRPFCHVRTCVDGNRDALTFGERVIRHQPHIVLMQQSASSTTVDHATAANAPNVAAHHTMLANSALSDGQLRHHLSAAAGTGRLPSRGHRCARLGRRLLDQLEQGIGFRLGAPARQPDSQHGGRAYKRQPELQCLGWDGDTRCRGCQCLIGLDDQRGISLGLSHLDAGA